MKKLENCLQEPPPPPPPPPGLDRVKTTRNALHAIRYFPNAKSSTLYTWIPTSPAARFKFH